MTTTFIDIHHSDGTIEAASESDPRIQAARALEKAAEKIAASEYRRIVAALRKKGRKKLPATFVAPEEAEFLTSLIPDVLSGKVSSETAMATLHHPEILKARTSPKK